MFSPPRVREFFTQLMRNVTFQRFPIFAKLLFQDGSISKEEFAYCWHNWIKKIVRPVSAFLVIDVQNDFISGSLAISNCPAKQNGEEVYQNITR